jgi:hypothetical protein
MMRVITRVLKAIVALLNTRGELNRQWLSRSSQVERAEAGRVRPRTGHEGLSLNGDGFTVPRRVLVGYPLCVQLGAAER